MPGKKSKKKGSGNERGFATTSVPAKPKDLASQEVAKEDAATIVSTDEPGALKVESGTLCENPEEERILAQSFEVVEVGTRYYTKLLNETEVEKRTRKSCCQLTLPEALVERILKLGNVSSKSAGSCLDMTDELRCLYTAELMLKQIGLCQSSISMVLSNVTDLTSTDAMLYYVVLNTEDNVIYEATRNTMYQSINDDEAEAEAEITSKAAESRMTELLSDEEDQELIEKDPNRYFVENQLSLLALRSRLKKDSTVLPSLSRLEKRSRVIEAQLGFEKVTSAREVQKAIQAGFLERAAEEHRNQHRGIASASTLSLASYESSISAETSDVGARSSNPVADESDHQLPSDANDIMNEASQMTSYASSDSADDGLFPESLFEVPPDASTQEESLPHQTLTSRTYFPFLLPKTSQNISPIKLLQTHLKRADKQARESFDPSGLRLVLRFSSSKINRKKVLVEDTKYHFPDVETAKNFLSLKALFSVPELAAEKAGSRFSGVFRTAWTMLEEEAAEMQRVLIAQKVSYIRSVHQARQTSRQEIAGVHHELKPDVPNQLERMTLQSLNKDVQQSRFVNAIWAKLKDSEAYSRMLKYRETLPIAAFRTDLMNAIENNQVTILCGETGCGKSTQLPTFILEKQLSSDRHCKIFVTEPRRISAVSLANRVSAELGESKRAIALGDSVLGFSIRLDSQVSDKSKLIYATTGIMLRMLEDNAAMDGITHLIIDEVHERSIESDFLLIVVKRLIRVRRDLRIILMSATLQSERFNEYFGGHCCIFNVPGRTFPVDQYFLEDVIESCGYICDEHGQYAKRGNTEMKNDWELPEDNDDETNGVDDLQTYSERTTKALKVLDPYKINFDLIVALLEHLSDMSDSSITSAILIFLPGMGEIRRLMDTLQAHKIFGNYHQWIIHALHSSIASDKQQAAFDVPPAGVRKIVIATNIAETGITIPDITCVIDAGKHKESRFDARRQLSKLVETFIAKSNAKQRMGRAGRVQAGVCFHLFTRARFQKMAEHQLPEFQRLNLDELALRVKTVRMGGIEEILLEALDPPTPENVRRSINNLIEVGALNQKQELTSLGKHLAKLPVDATLGKLILYGLRYSCLDPCLVVAAVLSAKSPFENVIGREREASSAKLAFVRHDSDFITFWTAYSKWRTVCMEKPNHEYKFCKESFLNMKNLAAIEELRLQYIKILVDSNLLQVSDSERRGIQRARFVSGRDGFVILPAALSANNDVATLVEACSASAFYPNLINLDDGYRTIAKGQNVVIHQSSVNSHTRNFAKRWIVFYSLLKTKTATNAHETGLVDDYIVALFCGTSFDARPFSGVINIDHNRIRFKTRDLRTLVAISILRRELERCFADFLEHKGTSDEWLDILADLVLSFEALAKQKLR